MSEADFDTGVANLYRTAEADGVFATRSSMQAPLTVPEGRDRSFAPIGFWFLALTPCPERGRLRNKAQRHVAAPSAPKV